MKVTSLIAKSQIFTLNLLTAVLQALIQRKKSMPMANYIFSYKRALLFNDALLLTSLVYKTRKRNRWVVDFLVEGKSSAENGVNESIRSSESWNTSIALI